MDCCVDINVLLFIRYDATVAVSISSLSARWGSQYMGAWQMVAVHSIWAKSSEMSRRHADASCSADLSFLSCLLRTCTYPDVFLRLTTAVLRSGRCVELTLYLRDSCYCSNSVVIRRHHASLIRMLVVTFSRSSASALQTLGFDPLAFTRTLVTIIFTARAIVACTSCSNHMLPYDTDRLRPTKSSYCTRAKQLSGSC